MVQRNSVELGTLLLDLVLKLLHLVIVLSDVEHLHFEIEVVVLLHVEGDRARPMLGYFRIVLSVGIAGVAMLFDCLDCVSRFRRRRLDSVWD